MGCSATSAWLCWPACLLAIAACASARGDAAGAAIAPEAAVVLPPPPAAPRVRVVRILPDAALREHRRPWWRILLNALTGEDAERAETPLFRRPFGLAAASPEVLFVADPEGPSVLRLDLRANRRHQVVCTEIPWEAPMAVALSADGRTLFVADAGARRVVQVAPDGACIAMGDGLLERPTGVVASPTTVFVADPPRHTVVAIPLDGREAWRVGSHGSGEGRLNFPTAVALAGDGTLLVVDALNLRVAAFSQAGAWQGSIGHGGASEAALWLPKAVAAAPESRTLVSDAQRDRVVVFGATGEFDFAFGDEGRGPGQFAQPSGVSVSGSTIFVADSLNGRVQVLEFIGDST